MKKKFIILLLFLIICDNVMAKSGKESKVLSVDGYTQSNEEKYQFNGIEFGDYNYRVEIINSVVNDGSESRDISESNNISNSGVFGSIDSDNSDISISNNESSKSTTTTTTASSSSSSNNSKENIENNINSGSDNENKHSESVNSQESKSSSVDMEDSKEGSNTKENSGVQDNSEVDYSEENTNISGSDINSNQNGASKDNDINSSSDINNKDSGSNNNKSNNNNNSNNIYNGYHIDIKTSLKCDNKSENVESCFEVHYNSLCSNEFEEYYDCCFNLINSIKNQKIQQSYYQMVKAFINQMKSLNNRYDLYKMYIQLDGFISELTVDLQLNEFLFFQKKIQQINILK